MSSPEPEGAGLSITEAKTHKAVSADMRKRRRKRTQQSPFKVPDTNSLFSVEERGNRKEEMRKFLSLPIDEKTTHAARTMAKLKNELVGEMEEEEEEKEEEEKNKKIKNLKPIQSKPELPRNKLRTILLKRESVTKDNKHDLISLERQKAVLELSLMTKKAEIMKMDKAIAKEERLLKQLEKAIERDNLNFEKFLRENEKKSVEARTHFEEEAKTKRKRNAEISRLNADIATIEGEIVKIEEVLADYKKYQELLFKLSPPEWQEAQRMKASKAKELQDDKNEEPEDLADKEGAESNGTDVGGELPSVTAHSDTEVTKTKQEQDRSKSEDDPELYFTDPQQLLNLMTELTEQNLSLIQNSARVEETLEDLQLSIDTTTKKIETDEEKIRLQVNELKQRIDKEKARGVKLQQKVELHMSLNAEDQDVMLDALSEKVSEVYRSCVDNKMTNLSTLDKLAEIESRLTMLLQALENLPEEKLEMMKRIKESEKRTRQREENLREQREKQKERMRRYLERSLADSKKTSGRKLMPRCRPVAPKAKVTNVDNAPAEDEMHEYLFGSDDTD